MTTPCPAWCTSTHTQRIATETRTEYAIKRTTIRHGKPTTVIEIHPGRESDRAWHAQVAADLRSDGTPDAQVVSRTVTVSEWT